MPDDRAGISAAIRELCERAELVLTTGGTGVAPRDNTPEATEEVLDRHVPGIAEALRADALAKTPHDCSAAGSPAFEGERSSSTFRGRPAVAATASVSCGRHSGTRSS